MGGRHLDAAGAFSVRRVSCGGPVRDGHTHIPGARPLASRACRSRLRQPHSTDHAIARRVPAPRRCVRHGIAIRVPVVRTRRSQRSNRAARRAEARMRPIAVRCRCPEPTPLQRRRRRAHSSRGDKLAPHEHARACVIFDSRVGDHPANTSECSSRGITDSLRPRADMAPEGQVE